MVVAIPARKDGIYQNNRDLLNADFYIDMLIHYHDDEGRSATGIAGYFNATNRNKIRIKNPLNENDKKVIDVSQISGVFIIGHEHQHLSVNFSPHRWRATLHDDTVT